MTDSQKKPPERDIPLEEETREETVDRLYDVVLDIEQFGDWIEIWEALLQPLAKHSDFNDPATLNDEHISQHFHRAGQFLDRLQIETDSADEFSKILAPFEDVAAFLVDESQIVGANEAARQNLDISAGDMLEKLPSYPADIKMLSVILDKIVAGTEMPERLIRIRRKDTEQFILFRLEQFVTGEGKALILIASNEFNWSSAFDDTLRQAFGLTETEASIVKGLIVHGSLEEIARVRDRSIDTIRNQLKSVLAKTETNSQVELVRLAISAMNMSSSVPAHSKQQHLKNNNPVDLKPNKDLMRSLKTPDGRQLIYLVLGDPNGRPILYQCNLVSFARWPVSAEIEMKKRKIKMIVPIRPGYGESDPVSDHASFEEHLVNDMALILDQEKVSSCPVFSLGIDVCFSVLLALKHPKRISAIIATSATLPITSSDFLSRMTKWHRAYFTTAKYSPHLLGIMFKAGFLLLKKIHLDNFIKLFYSDSQNDIDTYFEAETREAMLVGMELVSKSSRKAYESAAWQFSGTVTKDWTDKLNALKGVIPIICFYGEHDPQHPPQTVKAIQEKYDWIEYHILPDSGQLAHFRHWRQFLDHFETRL